MMLTDVLLFHARPAEELLDAASKALTMIRDLDISATQAHMVRCNTALGLIQGGRVASAAEVLPPEAGDSRDYSAWPLRLAAARLAVARGQLDAALAHLEGGRQRADHLSDTEHAVPAAEAMLWLGRPAEAVDLLRLLEGMATSPASRFAAMPTVLLARSAADAASLRLVDPSLRDRLVALRRGAHTDPLGLGSCRPAVRQRPNSGGPSSRGWTGTATVDHWGRAATEWDGVTRPHDAAYCRWRGARRSRCATGRRPSRDDSSSARLPTRASTSPSPRDRDHPGGPPMSALPRPDLPPGPHRDLIDALHDLHHRAGWPSLRSLAREAGRSHTTVSAALSSRRLPPGAPSSSSSRPWTATPPPSTTSGWPPRRPGPFPAPPAPGSPAAAPSWPPYDATSRPAPDCCSSPAEAGIGKTRLVDVAAAQSDVFVATGHCLPLSTEVPLLPLADALRALLHTDDGQWFKEAAARLPRLRRRSLAPLLPELATDGAGDGSDAFARHRMFMAVAMVLRTLAATRRLALLVEDLHWADPTSLDLLEHLVSRGLEVPVIGTWRTDDPEVGIIDSSGRRG